MPRPSHPSESLDPGQNGPAGAQRPENPPIAHRGRRADSALPPPLGKSCPRLPDPSSAPSPRTHHRTLTRSVATSPTHPDCRKPLIPIVALHVCPPCLPGPTPDAALLTWILIRRIAPPVPLIRSIERRQIHTVHQFAYMVRQVIRRCNYSPPPVRIRVDQHLHHHPWIVGRVAPPVPLVRTQTSQNARRTDSDPRRPPGRSHGVPGALPEPTPEDPAGAAAAGPAGTVGTSFPLTPLGEPQTSQNAFDTPKDNDRSFLRRRLLAYGAAGRTGTECDSISADRAGRRTTYDLERPSSS